MRGGNHPHVAQLPPPQLPQPPPAGIAASPAPEPPAILARQADISLRVSVAPQWGQRTASSSLSTISSNSRSHLAQQYS
jgi:hypothetical protein